MLKLFKYEMRKSLPIKLICVALAALTEAFLLYAVFTNKADTAVAAFALVLIAAVGVVMFMGLVSIIIMHRDITTRQSYMLFMTPNSTYKILGAKVLENTLAILLTGAVAFGVIVLDVNLLQNRFAGVKSIADFLREMVNSLGSGFAWSIPDLASWFFGTLGYFIALVTAGLLADVISCSLLSGRKGGGLLAFVLFVVLLIALGNITNLVTFRSMSTVAVNALRGLVQLVCAGVMYVITAQLMEKKLSV